MNAFETRWGGWLSTILRGVGFFLLIILGLAVAYVCGELGGRQIRVAIIGISESSNLLISGMMLSGICLAAFAVMFVVGSALVVTEWALPWVWRRYAFHANYRPYDSRRAFVLPPDVAADYAAQPKPTQKELDALMRDSTSFQRVC